MNIESRADRLIRALFEDEPGSPLRPETKRLYGKHVNQRAGGALYQDNNVSVYYVDNFDDLVSLGNMRQGPLMVRMLGGGNNLRGSQITRYFPLIVFMFGNPRNVYLAHNGSDRFIGEWANGGRVASSPAQALQTLCKANPSEEFRVFCQGILGAGAAE